MNYTGITNQSTIQNVLPRPWAIRVQEQAFGAIPFASSTDSVASVLGPFLTSQGCNPDDISSNSGLTIEGNDVTGLLLNQAVEYFQRGLGNLLAKYVLAKKGYKTWSGVTNY